jgi:hypothetical protein
VLSYTDVVLLSRKGRILTTLSPYIHLDLNAKLLVFAPAAQHVMSECLHTSFSVVLLQAPLFLVPLPFSTFLRCDQKIESGSFLDQTFSFTASRPPQAHS